MSQKRRESLSLNPQMIFPLLGSREPYSFLLSFQCLFNSSFFLSFFLSHTSLQRSPYPTPHPSCLSLPSLPFPPIFFHFPHSADPTRHTPPNALRATSAATARSTLVGCPWTVFIGGGVDGYECFWSPKRGEVGFFLVAVGAVVHGVWSGSGGEGLEGLSGEVG